MLDKHICSRHNAAMNNAQLAPQQSLTGRTHFIQSYAKINLTLDVLTRRADGYHELTTLMQTVDLYDTICLSETQEPTISITCSRPELATEDNLIVRAVQAVRQRLSLPQGFMIELHKRVPVAAGLGGGSSNAAATLLLLQQKWQLPLTASDLHEIAASLGSDVPFFLVGGLALCEGRGERITPLAPSWPQSMRWLLLLKPAISVSTAHVFRHLSPEDYSDGTSSRVVRSALEEGIELRLDTLHNSLQRGVLERYPEVAQAREAMLQVGASHVFLSGSGPTLFAPFANLTSAFQVQQRLQAQGYEVFLTRANYPQGINA
ncbi:4-(cytidine 5'-diphospho)-2-C-methyl-D-erythritol kinase [Ktedonospora formicarum]|uniref:4-diphosphocytidyl-2-C-methyl-D-erythritol kinase n=1 Tax=Ktedonospora formicarum TaxID=2778364 RepID=A0A8J3MSQ9_9CHLR|nr:4-(cytidine 5'-diphospho)-2-C-methyl-D-erythritol kinase [Ktedonospora formicarum]GHO45116.1 4-diphosphocytidyl-2-C-methyl-D-erythritol kinase [Ktedonospora formicarum]